MADAPPSTAPQTRLFGAGPPLAALTVIGGRKLGWRDLYHSLLGASWERVILGLLLAFLVLNALFATVYWWVGGIAHAETFLDDFFFSVQTLGTIGYGGMFPQTVASHLVVTVEAFTGMLVTAMVTGLVFAKFARPRARVLFSKVALIADRDGVPTLMFRLANERRNHVVEATLKVGLVRNEVTREGEHIRRVHDLLLQRHTTPVFVLTWTVMHPIVPGSPLYGQTPESLKAQSVEVVLTLTGIDETMSQTIHSRHSYIADEIRFAARFTDILSPGTAARPGRVVDYTHFNDSVAAPLTLTKMGVGHD